jgi:menaquinol-cytochrome c reductase iron-sulfur subunit
MLSRNRFLNTNPVCLLPQFPFLFRRLMSDKSPDENPDGLQRRNFLKRAAAVIIGGLVTIVPAVSGLIVFLDPLRKRNKTDSSAIRVASLSALPNDNRPHKFPVISSRTDAWNKSPETPIGAVYLRRIGEKQVEALHVVCPHAGCFVDFVPSRACFLCPCHNSTFAIDGAINDPKSPSPRGLDTLPVEIRGEEIFVKFQNFRAGVHEKIPDA